MPVNHASDLMPATADTPEMARAPRGTFSEGSGTTVLLLVVLPLVAACTTTQHCSVASNCTTRSAQQGRHQLTADDAHQLATASAKTSKCCLSRYIARLRQESYAHWHADPPVLAGTSKRCAQAVRMHAASWANMPAVSICTGYKATYRLNAAFAPGCGPHWHEWLAAESRDTWGVVVTVQDEWFQFSHFLGLILHTRWY